MLLSITIRKLFNLPTFTSWSFTLRYFKYFKEDEKSQQKVYEFSKNKIAKLSVTKLYQNFPVVS